MCLQPSYLGFLEATFNVQTVGKSSVVFCRQATVGGSGFLPEFAAARGSTPHRMGSFAHLLFGRPREVKTHGSAESSSAELWKHGDVIADWSEAPP